MIYFGIFYYFVIYSDIFLVFSGIFCIFGVFSCFGYFLCILVFSVSPCIILFFLVFSGFFFFGIFWYFLHILVFSEYSGVLSRGKVRVYKNWVPVIRVQTKVEDAKGDLE